MIGRGSDTRNVNERTRDGYQRQPQPIRQCRPSLREKVRADIEVPQAVLGQQEVAEQGR
jgi:hypothetical protein